MTLPNGGKLLRGEGRRRLTLTDRRFPEVFLDAWPAEDEGDACRRPADSTLAFRFLENQTWVRNRLTWRLLGSALVGGTTGQKRLRGFSVG